MNDQSTSERILCVQAVLTALPRQMADRERIDEITALQKLIAVASARLARVSVDFEGSQRADQRRCGVTAKLVGKGIADQIALARGISPHSESNQLALAKALAEDLPCTFQLWSQGHIDERTATGVAKQVFCLERADRQVIDHELASELDSMSAQQAERAAKGMAAHRCPEAIAARARKAPNERRVSIRPTEDMMVYLTALLPVREGVATYAALDRIARERGSAEARSRGQIMADALFERITGYRDADQIPLQISLVMPAATLVGTSAASGRIAGSVVPAEIARELALRGTAHQTVVVNRLFTDPCTGTVQSIDSRSRTFDGALREFILTRDQVCRTPYCEAPIRHIDHVQPHAKGAPTTAFNGQGLCERCNYAKEAPGWKHASTAQGTGMTHTVTITTPTGHIYRSKAPPILDKACLARSGPQPSRIEQAIEELLRSTLLSTA